MRRSRGDVAERCLPSVLGECRARAADADGCGFPPEPVIGRRSAPTRRRERPDLP